FFWLFLFVMLACSRGGHSDRDAVAEASGFELQNSITDEAVFETQEQKLIKESYLRFETQDLDATYQKIRDNVKAHKGYIQSDTQEKGYNELNRNIVVRIPSEHFQKTIDAINEYVSFFDTKRISSTDVTEEFIDLEARLKAKRTLENRYLELLSKAQHVKDILEIEKELSAIREEIEAREGRLKYLEQRVSYSIITISFYKKTSESGITVSYGTKIWNALKSGFNGLSYFFLALLRIWPFILILLVGIYIIRRKYFKKQHT
ncbi:MAG: DUF4349 domain-containing protein, partial [Bacteroidota bacterium]